MNNSHYTSENQPAPRQIVQRGGLFNTGVGCRALFSCGCLLILLLCIGSVLVVLARPPVVWRPVIGIANDNRTLTYEPSLTAEEAQASIIAQVKAAGQNEIAISEEALTAIARERIPQLSMLTIDVEPNVLKLNWYLDQSENPVIGEVVLALDSENKLIIEKLGTPSLTLPRAFNDMLQNAIVSMLDAKGTSGQSDDSVVVEGESSGVNVLQNLVTSNENFKISSATFEKDVVKLDVFVNISLF